MKLRILHMGCKASFLLSLVVLAMPCAAEDGDMFRGNSLEPGARPDGRTLTVAELDACLDIESEVRDLKFKIDQADMFVRNAESRSRGLSQVINTKRQFLDTSDQGEIDDFNELVKEQGEAVDEYNALAGSMNDSVDAHVSATQRFNEQCAEIAYYESDLVKARSIRERRLAASMENAKSSDAK